MHATRLRDWDVRYGRNVDAAVSLEQTLVGRSQEREAVEIVLVVDLDAFGQAGSRIARDDQADQHAVHVHLIAVRRSSAAKAPAVGEARIDGRVEGDDVAGEAVGDRDRPAQVDRVDDVQARSLERGHCAGGNAQGLVDAQRLGVAHQHRKQDVGAEVGHVVHAGWCAGRASGAGSRPGRR